MPRDLPLGNGSLLVAFDGNYQIRDLYWPHVGQENHAMGHPFRMGAWVDGEFRWLDDSRWERALRYSHETLVSEVRLRHPDLNLSIAAWDAVDFHENLLVRRFDVANLSDRDRDVRLFFHHDFHIAGNEVGDTAYYEPDRRAVLHYKGSRWFLANVLRVRAIDVKHERDRARTVRNASWTTPEEIAATIVHLCSDEAGVINGARIPLYGSP